MIVQRLDTPGLLLKIIADLKLPIKMIASGSSQLEIKSKVQEHLTGRQMEAVILPLSCREINFNQEYLSLLLYGSYPQVYLAQKKQLFLQELFNNYIQKDIIEFLQISKPDVMQQLLGLLAHASGQLLNFQQLAVDCKVNVETIQYITILSTPISLLSNLMLEINGQNLLQTLSATFIDNGFRNQALNNFSPIENRTDNGLLVQNLIFQELYKYQLQERDAWQIHYWRTKTGAEVDFVIRTNFDTVVPIEAKYRNASGLTLSRSYKSFLDAYQPRLGVIITKNQTGQIDYHGSQIYFIPLADLPVLFTYF